MSNTPARPRPSVSHLLAYTDLLLGARSIPVRAAAVGGDAAAPPVSHSSGDSMNKQAALDDLKARHDRDCPHCTNTTYHTQTVFGEGSPDAQLMFIGEAPGAEEDKTGRPFVGRAGQLLEKMINAMGLAREDVYIANVLKSRPPDNATPTLTEVSKCAPYLTEQIRIIRPAAIVALGAPSAKFLLQTSEGISRLRGQWHNCLFGDLEVPVMPTFHPAFLLRQYTPENRNKVWSDLQLVMDRLGLKNR